MAKRKRRTYRRYSDPFFGDTRGGVIKPILGTVLAIELIRAVKP